MTAVSFDLRDHPEGLPPVGPGEVRHLSVVFASMPDGAPASFPLIVLAGRRPGKTAVFVAGIHGDEYEGPAALWQLAASLDVDRLSGTVLIVPIANGAAFAAGQRISPVDGANLARIFPGDPDGTLSCRLADALLRHVVAKADVLVDSHSGGSRLAFAPVAGFYAADAAAGITPESAERSLGLAKAMGLASLWRLPPVPGVLSFEAARRGIAVTGCEIGGRGGCLARDVTLYLAGYRSVLAHAGLIDREPAGAAAPAPNYATYLEGDWLRSRGAGYLETHVDLATRVEAGTLIATLHGPFGGVLQQFRAAEPGFVMAVRHLRTLGVGDLATCVVREVPFDGR
ncbi:MAG: succinylglutamate desuccinylase/aspartoacylase family protein [Devosia sp.]|nr:succinylglutamate desuccinylase/aspartoacylase family protein [Devosia sp.]